MLQNENLEGMFKPNFIKVFNWTLNPISFLSKSKSSQSGGSV